MSRHPRRRRLRGRHVVFLAALVAGSSGLSAPASAQAPGSIGLGTADNFAVLAGQGVTNTGPTTVTGDLGTSPNPSVTGAGLTVVGGTIHAADEVAAQAQADLVVAYDDAAGRPAGEVATELGGQVLTAGAYESASGTFEITGTLTLDAEDDPDAVFVFQTTSTLITAPGSSVEIINGGSACNVFWQVGSSATLGSASTFVGTIMALASVTVTTGATVDGRVLARNGAVTLDSDTITRAGCTTPATTGTTLASSTNPSADGGTTLTATVTADGGGTPGGTVTFFDGDVPIGSDALGGGTATFTTAGLAPGLHQITAVYLGAPGFSSSTSQIVTQVVAPPAQTPGTTPTASGPTPTTGGPTASVPGRTTSPTLPATGTGLAGTASNALLLIVIGGSLTLLAVARPARPW